MVAAPRGRLGHILRAFQSEALAQIEQPDEEAVLRVKEYLVQDLVGFDSGSHRKLAVRQLEEGVENLETDVDLPGRGAVDEARNRSEPFKDFGLLGRALRTRERRAEVFFERHHLPAPMPLPNLKQRLRGERVLILFPETLLRRRQMILHGRRHL